MILVTGGTGFLGNRVVRKLAERNTEPVRCLVRPGVSADIFDNLLAGLPNSNLDVFPASFNDTGALEKAVEGVGVVLHLAASKTGGAAAQVANTVVGTDNLMRVCANANISRFVLCSSFGVMGAANIGRAEIVDENTPMEQYPDRRDPYSFAKHMQEKLAWEYYERENLPLTVIRPGVIFGPPEPILSARLGLSLFGLFLHLGGENRIPLTYKDNCADAIIQAGLVPGIKGEAFCITDDDLPTSHSLLRRYKDEIGSVTSVSIPFSVLKFLSLLNVAYTKMTKGHLPSVFTPYKVNSMWKGHAFSNRKAKDMMNWVPAVSMKDALDITFDYHKNRAISKND